MSKNPLWRPFPTLPPPSITRFWRGRGGKFARNERFKTPRIFLHSAKHAPRRRIGTRPLGATVNATFSRRDFVGMAGTTLACTAFGVSIGASPSHDDALLRPPGAQDTSLLHTLCLRCDRCRSVCPTEAIRVAPIEEGMLNARTPMLDFHRGYCDFCELCAQVCPTGAIAAFDPDVDKIGVAVVQEDRCLAYAGGCVLCVDACPYEALSLDKADRPIVDEEACNGCGLCEHVCPALVYRSFGGGTRRGIAIVPRNA